MDKIENIHDLEDYKDMHMILPIPDPSLRPFDPSTLRQAQDTAGSGHRKLRTPQAQDTAQEGNSATSLQKPNPLNRRSIDTNNFCTYAGCSMYPTLRDRELLEIAPYNDRSIRVGDVILFLPPTGKQPVVHRIVSVTPEGIRTRGDNNSSDDPYLLQPENIIGRVAAVWRSQKRRKIFNGRVGWLVGHRLRWQRFLKRYCISPALHPLVDFLSRWVHRMLPRRLVPRIVLFQANGQSHLRLLFGKCFIGQYDVGRRQWQIRYPFRLFVNTRFPSANRRVHKS